MWSLDDKYKRELEELELEHHQKKMNELNPKEKYCLEMK